MPASLRFAVASLVFLILLGVSSRAQADSSRVHVRMGVLSGVYTGPQTGNFMIPNAFDIEYEMFLANRRSFVFRSILAMELETSKPFYTYSGIGMRHYIGSKGMQFEAEDLGINFRAIPKWQYYFGWDAGVAQAIIKSLGRVLQIVSTMVDLGANAGVIYQIDRTLAVEAHFGVTSGQGFSSVSVVGYSVRGFGGFVYRF